MSTETDLSRDEINELADQLLDINLLYSKEISQFVTLLASSGEYSLLYCLYKSGKCQSSGELAETLGLSSGRIANVLKTLERKGLITRKRDLLDGRKSIVSLTDKGTSYVCQMYEETNKVNRSLIHEIGAEDTKDFIRIAKRLMAAYRDAALRNK